MKHSKLKYILFSILGVSTFAILSIIALLSTLAVSIASERLSDISSFSNDYQSSIRTEQKRKVDVATEPIGVLILGTDSSQRRDSSEGVRSDTIIYATVNPNTKSTHLYSISRDLYAWVDTDNYQKINAAYSIGGEIQTARAVEKLLNAPVDHFVSINMDALVEVVDEIDGITVNNTLGFPISIADQEPDYTATIDVGTQHINGEQALVYSRMRYQDPEGDVGRQKRQHEVINAIISKLLKGKIFSNLEDLVEVANKNVNTTIKSHKLIDFVSSYVVALDDVSSTNVIGRGQSINDIYYMIAGQHNLLEIQNNIRKELELEPVEYLEDDQLLLVDDSQVELDPSTHYEFDTP